MKAESTETFVNLYFKSKWSEMEKKTDIDISYQTTFVGLKHKLHQGNTDT